jgi:murein DD-endopeptidase MepM/ murein hydrolase activator NlpD
MKSKLFYFLTAVLVCVFLQVCSAADTAANTGNGAFQVRIIGYSPEISRGGSAVVIFEAGVSSNSNFVYVRINDKRIIYPVNFVKEGYYIALIPWSLGQKGFGAFIVAGNSEGETNVRIPFRIKKAVYRESRIKMDNNFPILDKFDELGLDITKCPTNAYNRYLLIMDAFAKKTVFNIRAETSSRPSNSLLNIELSPFDPMKKPRITSPYGEHRLFVMNGKIVGDSYHYGSDMASIASNDIFASNEGKVVFSGYNGAVGNMVLIDHGLGLYSLYCHLSVIYTKTGNKISAGTIIAKSGQTGYALGDHLHFSIIINGECVNPNHWMNKEWISRNIKDVIRKSSMIINGTNK